MLLPVLLHVTSFMFLEVIFRHDLCQHWSFLVVQITPRYSVECESQGHVKPVCECYV